MKQIVFTILLSALAVVAQMPPPFVRTPFTTNTPNANQFSGNAIKDGALTTNLNARSLTVANGIAVDGGWLSDDSLVRVDSTGNFQSVIIGSGITFDGTTLSATGGAGGGWGNPTNVYYFNDALTTRWTNDDVGIVSLQISNTPLNRAVHFSGNVGGGGYMGLMVGTNGLGFSGYRGVFNGAALFGFGLPSGFDQDGNLGIGTTAPAANLDVPGEANIGDLVATNGTLRTLNVTNFHTEHTNKVLVTDANGNMVGVDGPGIDSMNSFWEVDHFLGGTTPLTPHGPLNLFRTTANGGASNADSLTNAQGICRLSTLSHVAGSTTLYNPGSNPGGEVYMFGVGSYWTNTFKFRINNTNNPSSTNNFMWAFGLTDNAGAPWAAPNDGIDLLYNTNQADLIWVSGVNGTLKTNATGIVPSTAIFHTAVVLMDCVTSNIICTINGTNSVTFYHTNTPVGRMAFLGGGIKKVDGIDARTVDMDYVGFGGRWLP